MGKPAAKQGDSIMAMDMHLILTGPGALIMVPHPFDGIIDAGVSPDVNIEGKPAAVVGSTATNTPPHIPSGGSFANAVLNRGEIKMGSMTVSINGKAAARAGDMAMTCNDPTDLPQGQVVAVSTVSIGG